jgi:hypothetical protein
MNFYIFSEKYRKQKRSLFTRKAYGKKEGAIISNNELILIFGTL